MIVDDHATNVERLEERLRSAGYDNLVSTTEPNQVLPLYSRCRPDLIMLDPVMTGADGFEVMEKLRPVLNEEVYLPVLAISADPGPETRRRALSRGSKDFLGRPFDGVEMVLRVKNLLETRLMHLDLRERGRVTEESLRERGQELESARTDMMDRLARAAEFRDDDTGEHTRRVGRTAALVARRLGFPEERAEMLRRAAPLHDIGKIAISDRILLKPGRLTPEEFERVKTHTIVGAELLSGSRFPLLRLAEEIALNHHERWDGTGYPRGLKGVRIPLAGRITAVADVFDALVHERPYKPAWPVENAGAEIQTQKGRQFDPHVVEAFFEVLASAPDIR